MAASGMPLTLSEKVKSGEMGIIKRIEFEAFKTLMSNHSKLKRAPNYADYTIVHPSASSIQTKSYEYCAKH